MKVHTTNYKDTFITVADDCPVQEGTVPPVKNDKQSVANIQFDLIIKHPYRYTSDDVLFEVYAEKNHIPKSGQQQARETFFSKGQPCLRASPLTKRYGWGVHHDANGKVALYPLGSEDYEQLKDDSRLKVVKAMRSSR